jgi:putative ABC transport system ATP-binding protein
LARRHPNGVDWLLHDVSLSVRPGERLAISGPSGSGKTLLLRALALLDQCDTGQVLWRGDPVRFRAVPEFRSRTIYLHQRPAPFEGSVEDNLRQPFLLSVHAARGFDRDWIAERLGSVGRGTDLLERASRDLSGGESQLVALLRALQLRAPVLLLDEPTAALDAETATAAERLVADWQEEDQTRAVVWITHNREQSRRVATRTARMVSGRLEADG